MQRLPKHPKLGPEWSESKWLLGNFFDADLTPKTYSTETIRQLSFDPKIHEVLSGVMRGKSLPPEILNEEILEEVKESIDRWGVKGAIRWWSEFLPKKLVAIMRAVRRNVYRRDKK